MKYLKSLAALALPVVAAMSLGVPANAAPSNDPQLLTPGAGDTGSDSRAGSPGTTALVSYIYNGTSVPLGVIYARDGNYKYGNYDEILPAYSRTDGSPLYWNQVDGVYIGPGYCAEMYRWDNANPGWWYHWWSINGNPRGVVKWTTAAQDPYNPGTRRYEVRDVRRC